VATAANIREKLEREPFEPFRLRVTSGDSYVIRNPGLVVVMRSELFIAEPNSDRHVFLPLLHIAAIENLGGSARGARARKSR
jgi:hypothetical protein